MSAPIRFDTDLAAQLGAEISILAKQVVSEMATAQIVLIQRRAEQGIGLEDAPMPAYSAAYARQKAKSGRSVSERNLSWSGSMLRAVVLERVEETPTGHRAVLSFATQAQAEIAGYNQERAPWFGVSPSDAKTLEKIAQRRLEAVATALNSRR